MSSTTPLRTALVGCGGMGMGLAQELVSLPDYQLVAGCDLLESHVEKFKSAFPGTAGYTDFATLLAQVRPDVVVIATNNVSHAPLTIQAADAGVRGIYCEKPMAACLADGQAMVEACRRNGAALVVNHQRRMLPVFVTMRRLVEAGAIGQIELIRGSCAGDVLSDGTHTVDTIRHLTGDAEVKWVFGQVMRDQPLAGEPRGMGCDATGGWRYGHPVESGALALMEFENGVRAEVHTGAVQIKGRRYQDFEVFGSEGRLHRAGDAADPPLLIQTNKSAGWQPVQLDEGVNENALQSSLKQFVSVLLQGASHPLSGDSGLKDLEIVMAIYESARLRARVNLPLGQPRYPLEIMIEEGQM